MRRIDGLQSRIHGGLVIVACLWMPCHVAAQVIEVSIPAVQDNTLYEDPQGALSNGSGTGMFAGTSGATTSFLRRRALVKFDVAAHLPAGVSVRGVQLGLHVVQSTSGDKIVSVHRVLASWGEGSSMATGGGGGGAPAAASDATWVHRFYDTQSWTTPGGDFVAMPSATTTVGDLGLFTWESTQNLVDDVQGWLDDPANNAGWILIGEESGVPSAKRFATREGSVAEERPFLHISYAPLAVFGNTWSGVKQLYR